MRPQVSFSVNTSENGWSVRRIDSHEEGPHGEYVFTNWGDVIAHLHKGLSCVTEVREKWEAKYGKGKGKS